MSSLYKCKLDERSRNGWLEEVIAMRHPAPGNGNEMATFLEEAKAAAAKWLPAKAAEAVRGLNRHRNYAALVITNLPVDPNLPPMPEDGFRPASKTTAVSEAVLLGIANLYGTTYTYQQEKRGSIPADVVPMKDRENTQSNASRGEFLPHADNHFLRREYQPEALFLVGLVGSEARTKLFPVAALVGQMDCRLRAELMQPKFQVRIPESFDLNGYEVWSPPRPLLSKEGGALCVTATTLNGMRGIDPEAKRALRKYGRWLGAAPNQSVVIGPGVLLGFSNRRNLHARTAFEGPRWLQRCYARQSLEALHRATGVQSPGYVFDTRLLIG